MGNSEGLVGEPSAVNALASAPIAALKVASLNDEVLDDAVESAALVAITLLTAGKRREVRRRLWDDRAVEADHHAARWLVADADVEEHATRDLGPLRVVRMGRPGQHAGERQARQRPARFAQG